LLERAVEVLLQQWGVPVVLAVLLGFAVGWFVKALQGDKDSGIFGTSPLFTGVLCCCLALLIWFFGCEEAWA
jgi:hypothetical protein